MNTNFKRKLLAGLLAPAVALAVGSAFAQSSSTSGTEAGSSTAQGSAAGGSTGTGAMWNTQHFDRLDKNRDGRISREEAQGDSALTGAWSKLDTANSGSVSREDFDKYARTLNPNSANPMQNNVPGKGPQK